MVILWMSCELLKAKQGIWCRHEMRNSNDVMFFSTTTICWFCGISGSAMTSLPILTTPAFGTSHCHYVNHSLYALGQNTLFCLNKSPDAPILSLFHEFD